MLKHIITEFFFSMDDFCFDFELEIQKHLLESPTKKSRKRAASLADCEIMSILGALTAYCFFPKKPSLSIEFELPTVQLSLSA